MRQFLLLIALSLSFPAVAQIVGTVTDNQNQPLPYVNIYVENTYTGTISNEKGQYDLPIKKPGKYTIIFQYLGFKTVKKYITPQEYPYTLDITMEEENYSLDEVVINSGDNPADAIIRNAIASKR